MQHIILWMEVHPSIPIGGSAPQVVDCLDAGMVNLDYLIAAGIEPAEMSAVEKKDTTVFAAADDFLRMAGGVIRQHQRTAAAQVQLVGRQKSVVRRNQE